MSEKNNNSNLDISVDDYYFGKLRPFMKEMLMKCKTDGELQRTIEKVINSADGFCNNNQLEELDGTFNVLDEAISDPSYFDGVMKKAPETEKEMVRELISKISDLRMIIKYEDPVKPKEVKVRERLGYSNPTGNSPNGENEDFLTHNMETLNKPVPKKRIPNR